MMQKFFLQMSGVPGSGKTTVATAIAEATGAIILDHDVSKSALLNDGVPVELAGGASYAVLKAMARHLLQQQRSVIFDSPCLYPDLLANGMQLSDEFSVAYLYVECVLKNLDELDRRLRGRKRHRSQLAGIRVPPTEGSGKTAVDDELFLHWMDNMQRPKSGFLVLDTSRAISDVIGDAMTYVTQRTRYQ